ncbi:putative FHY3/FAR1 family protein [Helianthus annuus]|nr:putative FHY3/FAR1 family protein [Helianthus annuus]
MQSLENILIKNKFIYETWEEPRTKVVTEIFFIHPYSSDMWRAFPHVMLIDSTYKTNVYNMSFVQIVGMTPTNYSLFHVAVDWDALEAIGEIPRLRYFIPVDSPWHRLFELAHTPSYRSCWSSFYRYSHFTLLGPTSRLHSRMLLPLRLRFLSSLWCLAFDDASIVCGS